GDPAAGDPAAGDPAAGTSTQHAERSAGKRAASAAYRLLSTAAASWEAVCIAVGRMGRKIEEEMSHSSASTAFEALTWSLTKRS
ncbi:MAG: hypothetical protein AB7L76_11420, partial [Burkholderiaceae bacterium]